MLTVIPPRRHERAIRFFSLGSITSEVGRVRSSEVRWKLIISSSGCFRLRQFILRTHYFLRRLAPNMSRSPRAAANAAWPANTAVGLGPSSTTAFIQRKKISTARISRWDEESMRSRSIDPSAFAQRQSRTDICPLTSDRCLIA